MTPRILAWTTGECWCHLLQWEKTVWIGGGRIRSSILSVLGLSCQVGSGIYQSGAEGTGLE